MFKYQFENIKLYLSRIFSEDNIEVLRKNGLRSFLWNLSYADEVCKQKDLYLAWRNANREDPYKKCRIKNPTSFSIVVYNKNANEKQAEMFWRALRDQVYRFKEIQYFQNFEGDWSQLLGEYIVLTDDTILLQPNNLQCFAVYISTHPDVDIIYCDEDSILDDTDKRGFPFFKPDWSPDTFLSFQYFGKFLVVRKALLHNCKFEFDRDPYVNLYELLLILTEHINEIGHIDKVLFSKPYEEPVGDGKEIKEIKERTLKRRNYNGDVTREPNTGIYRIQYKNPNFPKVSIIIPSKDNPGIINQCLKSIRQYTSYKNFDIIVIDNGSSSNNKIEYHLLCEKYEAKYLYYPIDFNYSKMCNIGAKSTDGEFLLFLNDDIEVINENWIELLVGHASLPYVGAVGAKLLYPNTNIIQHVGVTNLKIGPAHKLSLLQDDKNYYFGRNYLEYNYLAVTGACLMLERKKYNRVGGFDENLRIRYNDVELCFSLYEMGYYNIVRTDVVLYHHESLSRGDDTLDNKKMLELKCEREKLYSKHSMFYNHDPFYNTNLVDHKTLYEPNFIYNFEERQSFAKYRKFNRQLKPEWYNSCFKCVIENIQYLDECILLEGWTFVMGADNSAFKRNILLLNNKMDHNILCSLFPRYRDDVVKQFPNEKKIALSGFVSRIPYNCLEVNAKYRINLIAKAKFSRQVLLAETDTIINPNKILHNSK